MKKINLTNTHKRYMSFWSARSLVWLGPLIILQERHRVLSKVVGETKEPANIPITLFILGFIGVVGFRKHITEWNKLRMPSINRTLIDMTLVMAPYLLVTLGLEVIIAFADSGVDSAQQFILPILKNWYTTWLFCLTSIAGGKAVDNLHHKYKALAVKDQQDNL